MDIQFILSQVFGFIAWLLLVISYFRESTNKILAVHIIASIFCALHYFFLGAYSGLFICSFEVLRDYAYFKTDPKADKYIFMSTIPIYIIYAAFTYTDIYGILPLVACLLDGWSLTKYRKTVIICAIIGYSLWVIYNIHYMSYVGILSDGLVVIANVIALFKKDIFKEDKLESIFNK